MPKVIHVTVYEKKLVIDSYTIAEACCKELKEVKPTWTLCPFCGAHIDYIESREEILDVPPAKPIITVAPVEIV